MSYQASPMETTTLQQTPFNESFSYGWLANIKYSSFDPQDEASFIEMDPILPPSKRFIRVSSALDLVFELPVSDSPLSLIHADELISNGFLVPVFVKDTNTDHFDAEDYYVSNVSISSTSDHKMVRSSGRARCSLLRRCRITKYLMLLLKAIFCKRGRGEFEAVSSSTLRMYTKRKCGFSNGASPRSSVTYSGDDNWRRSCDSESSIYEAVLHCKRTHQGNSL